MAIITLTSDLGANSHYPAIVKGIMLSRCPGATLVDVTHSIPSYDLMQAAYVVKQLFRAYPTGTVHMVGVDPDQELHAAVAMAYDGHYFVGPDNGVLSLIAEGKVKQGQRIEADAFCLLEHPRSFRAGRLFAPAAAFLASGGPIEDLGPAAPLRDLRWGEPSFNGRCLRGKIIYIDKFGNAVTNIRRENFLRLKHDRRFEIFIRSVRLHRIVNTYSNVAKADALAIFGQGDHLEIAMREASAAELLGLKVHDMITIEFSG